MAIQNPVPDWKAWRNQWEYAHFARFLLQISALAFLLISIIWETPRPVS
jgi:hypothetical protein